MKYIGLTAILLCAIGAGCLSGQQEVVVDEAADVREEVGRASIEIDSPVDGSEVSSPLVLTGAARVFEGTVSWRLKKMNGAVVDEGFFMVKDVQNDLYGTIDERIFLSVLDDEDFILEVFQISMADGSMQDLVTRQIRIKDEGKTSVRVYFTDPSMIEFGDCSLVDFEKRTVAHTVNVAELAIRELLAGPTSTWARTELPPYTRLDSVKIESGTAIVNFRDTTTSGWNGGSCHVEALRAQIEETLLQFETIDSVIIKVNGSENGILEP